MLPASSAALIMLVASVWDIINDPIIGVIADKTNTPWADTNLTFCSYLPYSQSVPSHFSGTLRDLAPQGQLLYVGAAYICYGMLYTVMTMPHMAVLPR